MLAIITPTYNRKEKTLRYLECLGKQTFKDFKVYIVDSGSTDGSVEAFRSKDWGFPVDVVGVSSDKFWTGATNAGVSKALAEGMTYIMTLNDDAMFSHGYLSGMMELADRLQLKILTSRVDYLGEDKIWMLGSENRWSTGKLFVSPYHGLSPKYLPLCFANYDVVEVQSGCGNGVLIQSDIFRSIGLYDEVHCPHYHGDSEFLLRARKAGYRVYSTTKISLQNDYSDFKGIWARGLTDIWKSIRSPHYYPAVSWIVDEYGPPSLRFRVKFLYYIKLIVAYFLTRKGFLLLQKVRSKLQSIAGFGRKLSFLGVKCLKKVVGYLEQAVN